MLSLLSEKLYCPCREDPLSPAVGRMVWSRCGKRETHLSGKQWIFVRKLSAPLSRRVLETPLPVGSTICVFIVLL